HAGRRITDLCVTVDGYVAVAVDGIGIVFQDPAGNTVQVLGRSLDHRLARVVQLAYAPSGVLWGLLNEGVVRVEFPSPVSRFEPLINGGLFYPRPLRHAGELWVIANGRAMHGQYDEHKRLERFNDHTPPGRYLAGLASIDGALFGTSDAGIYSFEDHSWKEVVSGVINARLGVAENNSQRIYFVARGEYGWIEKTSEGYSAHRIPMPDLGDSYGAAVDAAGIGWIEMGTGLVGRFDARQTEPKVELLETGKEIARGWVEIFVLEGIARFHVSRVHYRFDETNRRFVEDRELLERFPRLVNAGGRPVMDRGQRLWFTSEGAPHVIDYSPKGAEQAIAIPPIDFFPTIYTLEEDGVAWLSDRRRLARVDLRLPSPPQLPLRALITSVQFSASGRQVFAPGASLPALDYSDNSLVIHFAAPANPFALPVTFEVLLEGSGTKWVSTGTVGSAAFNRLKEGNYVFRVRPVARGAAPGAEASVAFTVRPPWYRTNIAWVIYMASAAGFVATAVWLTSFLQRRENERLERLVTERTRELHATNGQLGRQIVETTEKSAALSASEERYRTLNTELEQRVAMRTAELSHSNSELQQRESLFRLVFEHAPVGISWRRADQGDIFHLNPTFRRILSLSRDELMDHTLLAVLVHPEDAERQAAMARSIESGESNSFNL
ncbi:MAG TPA: PAS domain-containing protein, partial [Opitutus sp.]|nr:PAS domain-containing protein [Opitutus sp.]